MLLHWLLVASSLVLLYFGAESLVRGSASLALRLGITPLVVGLTVVAMGTSSPEILVSVSAALDGRGDLAVGNVIGSNLLNVGVILGLTALIQPIRVRFHRVKWDAPLMVAIALLVPLLLWDARVSRLEGALLLAGIVSYVVVNIRLARRASTREIESEFEESIPKPTGSLPVDVVFVIVGLGVLALGAHLLTENSVEIARGFGVSEAVIGLTVVAFGTSVPELAASVVAALKKEPDIAIGNVIGSNVFNVLAVLGSAAAVAPLEAGGIGWFDTLAMVVVSAAVLPVIWTGMRVTRLEGGLLLALYAIYLGVIWPG
jgi:cation:H+ antiporter